LTDQLPFPYKKTGMFLPFFLWRYSPNLGLGLPPWNSPFHFGFLYLRQTVGLLERVISSSQGLYLYTNTEKLTHTQTLNTHALSEIRTHDSGFGASEDSACLRPLGYRDRLFLPYVHKIEKYLELKLQTSPGKCASPCIIFCGMTRLARNKQLLQREGRVSVWPIDFHTKLSQMLLEINHTNRQT
jgi:hypothetical protein